MANWLNKYEQGGMVLKKKTKDNYGKKENPNDIQASVGPDFVGLGYNTKGRDYSPAWGGQFQDGGALPEVTVYGHRNPGAKAYFDKVRKDAEYWQDRDLESPINGPMAEYLAKEQMYGKYGSPKINVIGEDDRPHYNPFSDSINIPDFEKDYEDSFFNELAHKVQANQKGRLSFVKTFAEKDLVNTLKNISIGDIFNGSAWKDAYEKNYFAKDTLENNAHEKIYPKLMDEFKALSDKEYEKLTANKKKAMGGGIPGAVGFTYARTQNPAPSNGKYAKKTLASAQDGKKFRFKTLDEMAAYNISNDNIPSRKQVENKVIKDEQAKSEIAKRKELANRETVRSYDPETENESTLSRAWNIISHPMTALSYKTRGKDIPEHFERGEHNILENATNILNPFFYANEVKGAAGDLSTYYDDVKSRGLLHANPYVLGSSALHTLNALPLLSEAAPFISKAASSIPTSSRYISKLENLGQVQTSGINKRAVQMMMGREPGASNVLGREAQAVNNEAQTLGTQSRSQRLASYEPPTDAEIAAMNEAEANRYFRRPEQEARRPVGISQAEIEEYLARDPQARSAAQAATNDLRNEASSNVNMDAIVHSNNPMITERRLAGRQTALRTSGFTDAEIAADEAALRRGDPIRTPAQIRGGGVSTFDLSRNRVEAPMKEWNSKEFRIGEGNETGITKMKHPDGQIIKQDVTISQDVDGTTWRNYDISDEASSSKYIKVSTTQDPGDPFTDVNDISFFNRDPKSSSKQMNIVFSHLPTKARIAPINTSMHSQPLLDMRMAKLNSGQPGRIQIKPEYMDALNKITREEAAKPIHWYDEAVEQFPKLQKSTNALNEYTGAGLKEPFIKYKGSPISFEEFKTPEMRKLFENPQTSRQLMEEVEIMVNKYKTIKNWKNGGQIVDPMGQWTNPGEVTTVPSNDITMRGVNYDVMGVSNTGDKKLMKPGKNYKFDGDYVTEYPRGGWLEKYK